MEPLLETLAPRPSAMRRTRRRHGVNRAQSMRASRPDHRGRVYGSHRPALARRRQMGPGESSVALFFVQRGKGEQVIHLVIVLAVIGFLVYLLTTCIPMAPIFRTVIYVVVAIVLIPVSYTHLTLPTS